MTREVAVAAAARVRSGTVGRRLRGMLMAGASARLLFDIDGALDAAVAAGRVTPDAALAWGAEGARADARGRHRAAMTAFMAWGRVGRAAGRPRGYSRAVSE